MFHSWQYLSRTVALQLVRNDHTRHIHQPLEQLAKELLRGQRITPALKNESRPQETPRRLPGPGLDCDSHCAYPGQRRTTVPLLRELQQGVARKKKKGEARRPNPDTRDRRAAGIQGIKKALALFHPKSL
jgi:hypothetical protein